MENNESNRVTLSIAAKNLADPRRQMVKRLRFSAAEWVAVKERMEAAGVHNFSSFSRRALIHGDVYIFDYSYLRKFTEQIARVGNNINQIARRVNVDEEVTQEQMNDLKMMMNEVRLLTHSALDSALDSRAALNNLPEEGGR
ncbi:plasmid mobilization protein [Lacticaseibacillus suibinensis]|uniref:plasmid mobilization protein n=1 Tax=Lacticaseibacillus suibinensis TaxID=2486011 RepID=UPI000F7AD758|nr:plasmid mobilization relaxosome protein MobC [Lacticaseibacillus suibinensis]